ncbi:MAG: hypothetical protein ABIF82_12410 [Planctomycetota bacterium]
MKYDDETVPDPSLCGGEFTAEAKARWDELPRRVREEVLDNVWCSNCSTTTITRFQATLERGDVVLRGYCAKCGKRVARVIEPYDP